MRLKRLYQLLATLSQWTVKAAALVFAIALFVGFASNDASAQVAPATAGADSGGDAHLKDFLQKRLRLPGADSVTLGPQSPSPIAGLWTRTATLKNPQGQTAKVVLFGSSGNKVIAGSIIDLGSDPWGRVSTSAVHLDDRPTLGPADAPVTIIEFADFECPFCARAFTVLETMVRGTYRDQIRLIFKSMPLAGHQWAKPAAIAAECVRLQNPDAFWQLAQELYRDQGAINPKNLQDHVHSFAKSAKLDVQALDACIAGKDAEAHVAQDAADGATLRATSTPTFIINGIPVIGFPDEKVLDFVVSSELRDHQKSATK